jgi:hypothetical protein
VNSRVVHQNIDPAKPFDNVLHARLDLFAIARIAGLAYHVLPRVLR